MALRVVRRPLLDDLRDLSGMCSASVSETYERATEHLKRLKQLKIIKSNHPILELNLCVVFVVSL